MGIDDCGLTDADFERLMTEIDQDLRVQSEAIPGRELRGWFELCKRIRLSADLDHPLAHRTFAWFSNLYGERLKVDFDLGTTVVTIFEDLYRLRCISIYGRVYALCHPAMGEEHLANIVNQSMPGERFNILDNISDLTPLLKRRLSVADCNGITNVYQRVFLAFSGLRNAGGAKHLNVGTPYIHEGLNDLAMSVSCLFPPHPAYGNSRWASLQATEKIIKSFILSKNGQHKNSHHIDKDLLPVAYGLGLPQIAPHLIATIQCEATVRYNTDAVNRKEAVDAHYAVLEICAIVAPFLKRINADFSSRRFKLPIQLLSDYDALLLYYSEPRPPFIFPK